MNKKRYWLRWGIIIASIYLVLALITWFIESQGTGKGLPGMVYDYPFVVVNLPTFFIWMPVMSNNSGVDINSINQEIVVLTTVFYFIIGTALGFFYGKLKNKKK